MKKCIICGKSEETTKKFVTVRKAEEETGKSGDNRGRCS